MGAASAVTVSRQPPRWCVLLAIPAVLVLSILLAKLSITIAAAGVVSIAALSFGLVLLGFGQYAVLATLCVAVGIFVDWYYLLPYPFGGSGIPFAPVIVIALLGFRLVTGSPAALRGWSRPLRIWLWLALLALAVPALIAGISSQESMNYYLCIV